MSELPRVLCVDDEPNVLEGLRRTLGFEFDAVMAEGAKVGLERIAAEDQFAVVISDMKMPVMDGAAFLAEVRRLSPDTVRILLTGQADLEAAAKAVNEGQIFRFLQKPCPPDRLRDVALAAVAQYRLIHAERELLEKTLQGAVRVLTHVLELVSPLAFGRSNRLASYARHIAKRLEVSEPWRVEVAALLSQIGCVSLPAELLARRYSGQELTPEELAQYSQHPQIAAELLAGIPRLESVIEMIRRQNTPPPTPVAPGADQVSVGTEVLRLALTLDRRFGERKSVAEAAEDLRQTRGQFDPRLLACLEGLENAAQEEVLRKVRVHELVSGMVLDEDLCSSDGVLLAARGLEVTPTVVRWLTGMVESRRLPAAVRVRENRIARAA